MHLARHTFATDLRRIAGVEAASQALGHSNLDTTLGIYGHQDDSDLERAMERYAEVKAGMPDEAANTPTVPPAETGETA